MRSLANTPGIGSRRRVAERRENRRRLLEERLDDVQECGRPSEILSKLVEHLPVQRLGFAGAGACDGRAFGQSLGQLVEGHRLDEVIVHARRQALLAVALHGLRRHRDDARALVSGPPGADGAAGLEAVELRHLDVHENDVVGGLFEPREHLASVPSDVRGVAEPREETDGDLLIDRIVLGEQDAERRRVDRRPFARGLGSQAGRCFTRLSEHLEEPIAQMREPQGLREHRGKAGSSGFGGQGLPGRRQENEHRRLGTAHRANLPGERDTVHLGHLVIEKGDVEGVALTDPSQGDGRGVRLSGAHAPM